MSIPGATQFPSAPQLPEKEGFESGLEEGEELPAEFRTLANWISKLEKANSQLTIKKDGTLIPEPAGKAYRLEKKECQELANRIFQQATVSSTISVTDEILRKRQAISELKGRLEKLNWTRQHPSSCSIL